ncbi:MAG: SPOR domain-containing protein [Bacteroidales bacterium]|nr:SPOR domain-containing protein [Bacteroidales bacterium]
MKYPHLIAGLLTALIAVVFTSCKTNEANYRAAYEVAKSQQEKNLSEEGLGDISLQTQKMPSWRVVDGDSLYILPETFALVKDCGEGPVGTFNVVVGQFHQIFNAKAMRSRLMAAGYEKAMVVQNTEPFFYVIAVPCTTASEASAAVAAVKADKNITLKAPLPFVLVSSRR